MALGPRLDLRQTQSLVMTPQLQQAIKLLQMTNLEVTAFVEQQIEQNPLLEREDPEGGAETSDGEALANGEAPSDDGAVAETDGGDPPEAPDSADLTASETLLERDDAALDTDYENVWEAGSASDGPAGETPDGGQWNTGSTREAGDGEGYNLENMIADETTLRDHLLGQINVDLENPIERLIAAQLVESLDEAGYLNAEAAEIAESLGCGVEQVERTIEKVQRFDPPGIFARDLAECLALQLRDQNRLDPAMQALLDNLEMLGKREFAGLRKVCAVSDEDFVEMVNEIKALNPKPASVFDHVVAQPVVPDVFVRSDNKGGWVIELNSDTLPRVLVNSRYYATVSERATDKTDRQYLIDCYQSASWLVKSLQQRAQTILKVATELVHQQGAFFAMGVRHLRPLTLRDIAEEVGVHESTVSRVTNNKYIGTARGIFEMKYFFTSALGHGLNGDVHSAEAIRDRIKSMIAEEPPDGVLSDDKIVEVLKRDGVEIARRTVAKYRESMRIPSSVQRRREKALQA